MQSLSKDYNWLIVSRTGRVSFLVFSRYKTDSKYGTQPFDLLHKEYNVVYPGSSATLSGYLSEYVRVASLHEGAVVFPKADGSMYKASAFGAKVKALFLRMTGKGVGINTLRHSYISYALDQKQPHGILHGNQRSTIAEAMAHNPMTQIEYQRIDPTQVASDPALMAADALSSFLDARVAALDAIDVPSDEEVDDFEAAADGVDDRSDPFAALGTLANAAADGVGDTDDPFAALGTLANAAGNARASTSSAPVTASSSAATLPPPQPQLRPPPPPPSGPPRPAAARKKQSRRGNRGGGATHVTGTSRSGRATGRFVP
jgi:hypothetical protein